MQELIEKVNTWFEDRNLIEGSTDKDQVLKLMQELGAVSYTHLTLPTIYSV